MAAPTQYLDNGDCNGTLWPMVTVTAQYLANKDLVVTVGDSALSQDMFEEEYYKPGEKLRPLPLKWMAPETFETLFFSSKSDVVWISYGESA